MKNLDIMNDNNEGERREHGMRCPNCQSKDLGKIAAGQYYCWNCFIELTVANDGKVSLNQVEEDGSLTSLDDLFEEEDIYF
jgi:ribosomal protein L37AE/L43A